MIPALTPEQLLIIADEFCAAHLVTVRDFGALAGAAAVPGARINGIPVHAHPTAAGTALSDAVNRLEPLTGFNREFGEMCRAVYQRLAG